MSADPNKLEAELSESNPSRNEPDVLLKNIPEIEDYLYPVLSIDLNKSINAPLVKLDGYLANGDLCALMFAVNNLVSPTFVDLLLQNQANPNSKSNYHYAHNVTVLMVAVRTMPAQTIEALLVYGADVRLKDSKGHTVVDWAAYMGSPGAADQQIFEIDRLHSEKCLPLLAYLHFQKEQVFKAIQQSIHSYRNDFSTPLVKMVEEYFVDISDYSLALSRLPRYAAKDFFDLIEDAYKKYIRNKKLEKLASLSDATIDRLLREADNMPASIASTGMDVSELSDGATIADPERRSNLPLLFSQKQKVKKGLSAVAAASAGAAAAAVDPEGATPDIRGAASAARRA